MIVKTVKYLKEDYNRRTFIFTGLSILVSIAFAIYNGLIGLLYDSIWHASIFTYYVLLMCIKSLLITGERFETEKARIRILYSSFIILILITIAMIGPSIILVQGKRVYDWGLIPSITSATYTTYSITMAIINMAKVRTNDNSIVKQIKLINMITALMSVLVLQNTMIMANGGYGNDMRLLSIYTSIAIILSIVIIEAYSFTKTINNRKQEITSA